jgi:hypothetical protein
VSRVLAVLIGSILTATVAAAQPAPPRVYVFTKPTVGGFVDDSSRLRTIAVAQAIAHMRKHYRHDVAIATTAEEAEVLVEVLEAPEDATARQEVHWGFGISTSARKKGDTQIRATLSVGDYATALFTQHRRVTVAGQILGQEAAKWVRANRARLVPAIARR